VTAGETGWGIESCAATAPGARRAVASRLRQAII
jgi:hypothetical protein